MEELFKCTSVTARFMLLLILCVLLSEYFAISLFVVTISLCVCNHHILRDSNSLTLTVHTAFIPINNLTTLLGLHLSQWHLSSRINVHTQSRLCFIGTQMYTIFISFLIVVY